MKAIAYHANKDIRYEDFPDPTPGPRDVLIRPAFTGICATDIEEWQYGPLWVQYGSPNPLSGRQAPLVLGHETNGQVVEVGSEVRDFRPGDRVMVNNVMTCGTCHWCVRGQEAVCPNMAVAGLSADGGLAELMKWPASHVIRLPNSVAHDEAALIEPTTVAVRAARRSGVKVGDKVAVVGCGTVGLLTMQAMKAAGATVTAVDLRQQSLETASQLGADHTVNSGSVEANQRMLDLTGGVGHDIVLETAGAEATPRMAINWTRRGGTTVLVGIYSDKPEMDFNEIVNTERTVIGSVAAGPGDMEAAVDLVASHKIDVRPLITAKVPLDRGIEDGFNRMLKPEKDVFRILIQPNTF